jgi:hypothetical protein
MNELINHATSWLTEGDISPHDVGFKLNDILLSALARSKSDFYWKPREAFKQLADRCRVRAHSTTSVVRTRFVTLAI